MMTDTLGPYRLGYNPDNAGIYTGDSRELSKDIPDESIDLIFCDPIYDRIDDYRWLAETSARVLKPDRALLAFCGIGYLPETLQALLSGGLSYRWQGIWYQSNNMQRADMGFCNYSPFLWFEKGRSRILQQTGDVANIPIPSGTDNHNHKWNKRPELIERYLRVFSSKDYIVCDFFSGGGTVPAVCKQLNRQYLAFEVESDIAAMARERVHNTQPPLPLNYHEQLELGIE